jgi:2-polyprenyl-3-methyl-5-hydroxy-6-metoxy-1,4-benzoquinol methylase/glycosyltransferase involved in cell wall biosynthesis
MFVVMHCGGLPFNGETVKTHSLGGSETAAYYVARELARMGHKVTIFTSFPEGSESDGVRYEWAGQVSEAHPLGERFGFYAENTPHDICIIQRNPQAFSRKYASKINLLWLHDLALQRVKAPMLGQAWNIDGFLTVSEWHKRQVVAEWGLNPDRVYAIQNGIDPALFQPAPHANRNQYQLVYSSRPERGLEHLVRPGGIMERLADTPYRLTVCGYDNVTPQMEPLYRYLWQRCDELPNVENVGALTKAQLADLMSNAGALCYPTEFEEVSCITAMEAMAAGLPMITSAQAALPETCEGAGVRLIPLRDGMADEDAFVSYLRDQFQSDAARMHDEQIAAARRFDWANSAGMIVDIARQQFARASRVSLAHHFIRHSDIPAFEFAGGESVPGTLGAALADEYRRAYAFYRNDTFAQHYADYYAYEAARGVVYGPEDVTHTSRFRAVAGKIADNIKPGMRVLDYGCAHGHYTIPLARAFPDAQFVGIDLAESNVAKARAWAESEGVRNVQFLVGNATDSPIPDAFDAIIAAEVAEHVANPIALIDNLAKSLTADGLIVLTTPYGPWEAQGYHEHRYWRAHLHHFERRDLHEAFGHHPGFGIVAAPSGLSKFGSVLGSYITAFRRPVAPSKPINLERKIAETMPDATLSVCMIVKDAEADIARCLKPLTAIAQQFVIRVDSATSDSTRAILAEYAERFPLIDWQMFEGGPVADIGFAAARNETLARAECDWIMWIDSDEVLFGGDNLLRMLRNNQYNGYAIKQHHLSAEPLGVIKTDLPCRVFRNHAGIKFFGVVHEHPEQEMNKGLGHVCLAEGVQIIHHGYTTEGVRRGRFSRNIGLLERDRAENPDRVLGKFLWLRDLAQMCQYDEESGRADPRVFEARTREGIDLWAGLLNDGHTRLAVDALPYYSQLCRYMPSSFEFGFQVDASKLNGGAHPETAQRIAGTFHDKELAFALQRKVSEERMIGFDSRYF